MYESDTFTRDHRTYLREHQVIIDESRSVAYLDEYVIAPHSALCRLNAVRSHVIVKDVLRDPGTLSLPVAPYTHDTVMDMVSPDRHVDSGVDLDTCRLGSSELLRVAHIMDMTILDSREYRTHPTYDTRLLTVMDMASSYDMVTDILLEPTVILTSADGISFHLSRALNVLCIKVHIVLRIFILTERYSAALASPDLTILDYPSLAPVRADHSILICRRRRPRSSGLVDIKSAHGNIIYTVLFRHEAVSSNEYLDLLGIWILALEVGIKYRLSVLLLTEPLESRTFGIPGIFRLVTPDTLIQSDRLIHHLIVKEYRSRMSYRRGEIPVAAYKCRIGIIVAEYLIIDTCGPHISIVPCPVLKILCACDDRTQGDLGSIDDARILFAFVPGDDMLPVDTRSYYDLVTRLCYKSRVAYRVKRGFLTAVTSRKSVGINVIDHETILLSNVIYPNCSKSFLGVICRNAIIYIIFIRSLGP